MPSSGGSVSDNTVSDNNQYLASIKPDVTMQGGVKNYLGDQEVVNAPKYWKSGPDKPETELAYITKAEKDLIVKKDIHGSLKDGENIGPSGVISLDSWGDVGGGGQAGSDVTPSMDTDPGDSGWSAPETTYSGRGPTESPADYKTRTISEEQTLVNAEQKQEARLGKDDIISKYKLGNLTISDLNLARAAGWLTDNSFVNAIGGAFGIAMTMGGKAQQKAITWDLNRKLDKAKYGDEKWYDPEEQELLEDQIRRANLPKDDPDHYSQTDYMKDYPGPRGDVDTDGGDNDRGLVNIITPYAAHGIGGTTQQPSQAAQWYSTLGSSPSNPGAFNLTAQYAKAKAAVSQRLGNSTSVGQLAVNNSPFYNWLKDNSLNKGIL